MNRFALLLIVCALLGGGCVFLESINARPVAQVRKISAGPHYRGDRILFQADKFRDPDGSGIQISWRARACAAGGQACDAIPIGNVSQPSIKELEVAVPSFRASGEAVRAIRVELTVTDDDGAEAIDSIVVDILNHAPSVVLQSQGYRAAGGGYPIGTTVTVVAEVNDEDGDELALEWSLSPPPGSVPGLFVWEPIAESVGEDYRLLADVAGLWTATLAASDGEVGGDVERTLAILVQADQPPCILVTDPLAQTAARIPVEQPRSFAVRVVGDDLDPYPAPAAIDDDSDGIIGVATFSWSLAVNGGPRVALATTSSTLMIDPQQYAPGDQLQLRVEVSDRVSRALACAEAAPTCALESELCQQRLSWAMEVR